MFSQVSKTASRDTCPLMFMFIDTLFTAAHIHFCEPAYKCMSKGMGKENALLTFAAILFKPQEEQTGSIFRGRSWRVSHGAK